MFSPLVNNWVFDSSDKSLFEKKTFDWKGIKNCHTNFLKPFGILTKYSLDNDDDDDLWSLQNKRIGDWASSCLSKNKKKNQIRQQKIK